MINEIYLYWRENQRALLIKMPTLFFFSISEIIVFFKLDRLQWQRSYIKEGRVSLIQISKTNKEATDVNYLKKWD